MPLLPRISLEFPRMIYFCEVIENEIRVLHKQRFREKVLFNGFEWEIDKNKPSFTANGHNFYFIEANKAQRLELYEIESNALPKEILKELFSTDILTRITSDMRDAKTSHANGLILLILALFLSFIATYFILKGGF